jgi:hypothetical protein
MARAFVRPLASVLLLLPVLAGATTPLPTEDIVLWSKGGRKERITIYSSQGQIRVDRPAEALSVIFDSKAEHFIGLEHRDAHYWRFSWEAVAKAGERSKEAKRLMSASPWPDEAGREWESKESAMEGSAPLISGPILTWERELEGSQGPFLVWKAHSPEMGPIRAWCDPSERVRWQALQHPLCTAAKRVELAVVREILPPSVVRVWETLPPDAGKPVRILWLGQKETFLDLTTKPMDSLRANLFQPPREYLPTRLPALEGLGG